MKQIVIINKQYLQTYSPPSKSAIFFETYTFKFRNLYGVFGACVEWRTSVDNARETFHILLFLHKVRYIRQYSQPVSMDEYENIGKQRSLFMLSSVKTQSLYRLSDVCQPSLVRKWHLSCESFNQCEKQWWLKLPFKIKTNILHLNCV